MPMAATKKVSLDYKNADLTDVLKAMSYSYNLNIVIAKDVAGQVSAQLTDISLDEALNAILSGSSYSYVRKGNIVYVVEKSQMDLVTVTLPANYLPAGDLENLLKKALSSKGEIQVNKAINSLVVTDYAENISKIKDLLKNLDVMPIQVLIEVQIVSMSNSEFKNLGASINSMNYNPTSGGFVYSYNGSGGGTATTNTGANQFGVDYTYRAFDGSLQINSLIQKSKGRVLASPSISTLSGLEARILIGEQVPYKNITTSSNGNTQSTAFASAGTTLNVTPTVSPDGFITMKIHPEVSQVIAILDAGPRIKTTSADATVRVRNKQTFVIGGLINRTDTQNNSKDPIISSVPVLGWLFQSNDRQHDDSQVVVFITPYIIHSVEGTVSRRSFERKMPKGGDIFDELVENGYLDKISETEAYLKKNLDALKKDFMQFYPDQFENIMELLREASAGQPEAPHDAVSNSKAANQDSILLSGLLKYAEGIEKDKTAGRVNSLYASEELVKTYRMVLQEFPQSGKSDYCLYRIILIYAKEFGNCEAAKEALKEMKDMSSNSPYLSVTESLVDACVAVNSRSK